MSFFEKEYIITGWMGEIYLLTAKQLYIRVLEDSKSDYNWIAPANELVMICKEEGFPAEYSLAIKCAILNCFANKEHRANSGGDRSIDNLSDQEAVQQCYNSLYGIEAEEAISARKRYLTELINAASNIRFLDLNSCPDSTFKNIRENWNTSKIQEYISQKEINFKKFVETLHNEFIGVLKKAKLDEDFKNAEKEEQKYWKEFFKK